KSLIGFKTLVTSAMLVVGTYLLLNQQLNVGQFIAAEIVILTIIGSVEKLISNLDSVYDVLTSVEKIEKITDKETEKSGSLLLPAGDNAISIALLQTSFTYPNSNCNTLTNVSFSVAAGEKVSIQGNEGSGKSTLLRLLAGSYNNFEGAVLINDIPINNYNIQSLRSKTGVVISQQDIFEGTLMDNICMGMQGVDMHELLSLCNTTGLTNFISTLKYGFDTPLFATGRKLPAHAIKKILLIRALINKPKLLLLEEPWIGLEQQYQQQIKNLLLTGINTTVLVITKDEAFAKACDKVIVLKENGCKVIDKK
ncbi:MAG: ATP-binding cassette domain-containing protein, partial [Ferruginibacter sp.]